MTTYCIVQRTLLNALWQPEWKEITKEGIYGYTELSHFAVQQKPMQLCKATILQ